MRNRVTLLSLLLFAAGASGADKEWAEKVPFTTSWDDAIREARNTGKILFVYNGWERPDV